MSFFDSKEQWLTSAILYLLMIVFVVAVIRENLFLLKRTRPVRVLLLQVFALLFRSVWMFSKAYEADGLLGFKILSRGSTLLQLTSVSILVHGWYVTMSMVKDPVKLKKVKIFFVVFNLAFYLGVLLTTRPSSSDGDSIKTVDDLYRINSTILVFSFVLIFGASLFYGHRLKTAIVQSNNADTIRIALPKVVMDSWGLFIPYLLRALVSSCKYTRMHCPRRMGS